MIIEESDFKLEFDDNHSRFDLSLLRVINAKIPDKRREEFEIDAYGIDLDSALKRIINYRINKRSETITLKQYLEEYRKEVKIIENLILL